MPMNVLRKCFKFLEVFDGLDVGSEDVGWYADVLHLFSGHRKLWFAWVISVFDFWYERTNSKSKYFVVCVNIQSVLKLLWMY